MNQFATTCGFNHITSSPYYPQSNGLAERTVRTVKRLVSNSPDPFLALLSYRATPLPWWGLSPAELLMGRVIRTDVPQTTMKLYPEWSYLTDFKTKEERYRANQKYNYDQRHRTKCLPELPDDSRVWVGTPNGQIPWRIYFSRTRT